MEDDYRTGFQSVVGVALAVLAAAVAVAYLLRHTLDVVRGGLWGKEPACHESLTSTRNGRGILNRLVAPVGQEAVQMAVQNQVVIYRDQ